MATKKGKKLNSKQQCFVLEYLVDLNATQAAIRAGYSAKTAYSQGQRLLKDVELQGALQEAQQKRAEKVGLDAEWVVTRLQQVAERCMQAEPVMQFNHDTKEMEETGEYKFDSSGANKALDSLARHLGLFNDKVQVTGADGGPVQVLFAGIVRPVVITGDD